MRQESADPACFIHPSVLQHDNTVTGMLAALLNSSNNLHRAIDNTVIGHDNSQGTITQGHLMTVKGTGCMLSLSPGVPGKESCRDLLLDWRLGLTIGLLLPELLP